VRERDVPWIDWETFRDGERAEPDGFMLYNGVIRVLAVAEGLTFASLGRYGRRSFS
jgi:hypothetical protein